MKSKVIPALKREWNKKFPGVPVFFSYTHPEYSPNFEGIRRPVIYIRNYPKDEVNEEELRSLCIQFNNNQHLVEF